MVDKRDVAVDAFRSPAAFAAYDHRCESPAVLEHDGLSALFQGLFRGESQRAGEYAPVDALLPLRAHVNYFHIGERRALEAFFEADEGVFAVKGLVIGLYRRCGRSEQCLCPVH